MIPHSIQCPQWGNGVTAHNKMTIPTAKQPFYWFCVLFVAFVQSFSRHCGSCIPQKKSGHLNLSPASSSPPPHSYHHASSYSWLHLKGSWYHAEAASTGLLASSKVKCTRQAEAQYTCMCAYPRQHELNTQGEQIHSILVYMHTYARQHKLRVFSLKLFGAHCLHQ